MNIDVFATAFTIYRRRVANPYEKANTLAELAPVARHNKRMLSNADFRLRNNSLVDSSL